MSLPSEPFNNVSQADIILRSCDGFDFHVHSVVLSYASPFFRAMFSLPPAEIDKSHPIIPISEPARLIDRFLRIWYPGAEMLADFDDFNELQSLIELTLSKYDIQSVAPIFKHHLRRYIQQNCVGVFAVACSRGWADVAHDAAKESLKVNFFSLVQDTTLAQDLRLVSGANFQALLCYHLECGRVAAGAGRTLPMAESHASWVKCRDCDPYNNGPRSTIVRAWIYVYLDKLTFVLRHDPGANVQDSMFLKDALSVADECVYCQSSAFRDLSVFIQDKYLPAINEAIGKVPLELVF
ncbi:hypothetical protein R3P38DRAFT_3022772 [Favolaschia claudopus]|uniref:BTB domain-containing protein n=1 Tax=Favolaschia claudopus TaxID=2862362 RepID=A0AAW0AH18_9AGAR